MIPAAYLYVPGDRPERFAKAVASGAGAVILDLEDAVSVDAKADARAAVVAHLGATTTGPEQWVRINSGSLGLEDLDALRDLPGLHGVFAPKATGTALGGVTGVEVCAMVESAAAVLDLPGILAHEAVTVLALGEVDLAADLGVVASADERELWPFRMQVVAASVAGGRRTPIGPVFTAVRDLDGLRAHTEGLRRAGFESRQAIHPDQVTVINEVMAPTAEEIDEAHALLALVAAAGGGVCVDGAGRMIDEAVLRRARRTLERS